MLSVLSQDRISSIKKLHNVAGYQLTAINNLIQNCNPEGKSVLEIGGSNLPRELLFEDLKCSKWVCVDLIPQSHYALKRQEKHYKKENIYDLNDAEKYFHSDSYIIFDGGAENISSVFKEQFDIVFSVASFEHIADLKTVLHKIFNSLKPEGVMYSYFGPIWSGRDGIHYKAYLQHLSPELKAKGLGDLPEFAQFLMSPDEMLEYLQQFYPLDVCKQTVHRAYFSDYINRLFYEDYEKLMIESAFKKYKCNPYAVKKS